MPKIIAGAKRMKNRAMVIAFFLVVCGSLIVKAQTGSPAVTATGTPLAAYRHFFRHVQYLESVANSKSGDKAKHIRQHYQLRLGLSDQESSHLKRVSAEATTALDAMEQRAAAIINEERAKYPGGKLLSRDSLPRPPAELAQLQQERDNLTRTHIQSLNTVFSSAAFGKLDNWIKSTISATETGPKARPVPPTPSLPKAGGN
jgi:hypothetical protein